jgi:hypothetical protein
LRARFVRMPASSIPKRAIAKVELPGHQGSNDPAASSEGSPDSEQPTS